MQIDIQARDFPLTDALRNHILRRIGFSQRRQDNHIHRILVRLFDINGPRGGIDKCCQIQVVLKRQADVIVKDTESNLYAAIDRASGLVRQAIGRRIERSRGKRRSGAAELPGPLTT